MPEMSELALAKLKKEAEQGTYSREAALMKDHVREMLEHLSLQNGEFAQAVYQGGPFDRCMTAVARGCGKCLSDLEAYRRAVSFYFPGADVRMEITLDLCAEVDGDPEVPGTPEVPGAEDGAAGAGSDGLFVREREWNTIRRSGRTSPCGWRKTATRRRRSFGG